MRTETRRLPLGALLALATAVFITSLTETLPAGVLTSMSADLGVGASAMGQSVTIYAVGTALTAIPLSAATARWRRRRLLLTAVAAFAAANTVTAASSSYPLTMGARFVAGVAAGIAWSLLAGYARRLAPPDVEGRAIAVVMAGIPVALSLGVPAGTFLGRILGWRTAFSVMTLLALVLVGWILAAVPDHPGQGRGTRTPTFRALAMPGVVPVLFATLIFVLAHTILYAYVAPLLDHFGMGPDTDLVLLVFGAASLVSIWLVGVHIDRRLRGLMMISTLLVAVGAVLLVAPFHPVYPAAALWGLGWGGVPTLLQTAAGRAGGDAADTVQTMLVTLWNAAMAAGGLVGGVLLGTAGPGSLPVSVLVLLVPVAFVVTGARVHGFGRPGDSTASGLSGVVDGPAPLEALRRPRWRRAGCGASAGGKIQG
jgi:predicted MFS family arabinose efflux permease